MVITRRYCHIGKASQLAFFGSSIHALTVFAKNCGMWIDRNALDEASSVWELKIVLI